jgi:transcriptional regulator with XRE-family HTH domain
MPQPHSPTVRGRRLARELRELREHAALLPEQAAKRLGWSRQKVMRVEKAQSKLSTHDLTAILDLYGVSSPQREALVQLSKDAWKRGWWTAYRDVFAGTFLALEDEASQIRSWEPQLIPGLLQTPDYARSVIQAIRGEDAPNLDRRIAARMARRALLSRSDAPQLHMVVDEGALRRLHGGPQIMRTQLESLTSDAERPNVMLQLVPFTAGSHPGLDGSFVILTFEPGVDPDIAYIEGPGGDLYLEAEGEVAQRRLAFNRLVDMALSPEKSVTLIKRIAEEITVHA